MASPYQIGQQQDLGLSSPTGSQDWGFLQSQLYRSNSQYEQGEQKAVQGYASVLNTPVTGEEANKTKQQYTQQIQEGLKKVASTDLSLPQNVQQAESLYSPFWSDQNLLANSGLTKYYQNESSKLDGWENSTDKTIRSQYNKYSRMDLQNGVEQLANAPFDKNAYMKLQRRSATPFYDIDADVDAAWTAEQGAGKENGVSTSETNGAGAILTQYNGIKSKDAYKTYYLSKMADGKYDPQIQVMARVQNEQAKKEILTNNPGMSEQQVNQQFAKEQLYKLGESYKSISNSYQEQSDLWELKRKEIYNQIKNNQKGIASRDQDEKLKYYTEKANVYGNEAGKYISEYWNSYSPTTIDNKSNDRYERTFQDITEHANDYIGKLQKFQMADNWASGRAAISSEKKELDPVWAKYQDIAIQRDQIAASREKTQAELRGQTLDYEKGTGRTLSGEQLPGFDPNSEHGWYGKSYGQTTTNGQSTGRVLGYHTIEPGKLPNGLDIIEQTLHNKEMLAIDDYYNPDKGGISNIVLSQLGLHSDDIIDFTEAAKSAMNNGSYGGPKGEAAYHKVANLLQQYGVDMTGVTGPRSMMTKLAEYSSSVTKQLLNSDDEGQKALGAELAVSVQKANVKRDAYLTSQKNYDQSIKQEILNNQIYNKLTITNPDGTKRKVNYNDLVPLTSQLHLKDENDKGLSAEVIAKEWLDGKIQEGQGASGNTVLKIGDKWYDVTNTSIQEGVPSPSGQAFGKLVSRFGTSEELKDLNQKASAAVIPNLREFKNGIIAKEIAYDPNSDNPKESTFALNLAPELSLPSNTEGKPYSYDIGDNTKDALSQSQEQILRNTLSNIADVKAHIGSIGKTLNDEGQEVYVIHFKQPGNASETDPKFALAGKTVYMKESPVASGPGMQSIPNNSGLYIYGDLYDGGSYKEDPVIKATGMTYNVRGYSPNGLGQSTKSSVTISRTLPDPINAGQTIDVPVVQATIPMTGPDKKTPDEILDAVNRQVYSHAVQYKQNTNNAYRNITKGKTLNQIEEELKTQYK